ncbi:CaiB/BaiF CoA transferase family protein [Rhodopila sp.]|jgi:formyl-CoA transferase|uniref:CaiB/BaiF CoA transferase family protein n=1 Tax=Rhodopila sp. TaxID=2480087 RepID=UPI002B96F889|nr:CoA transferase [Rhodopila sp.]HVZ08929.1 CoA transferase [Rhodopila sp.]
MSDQTASFDFLSGVRVVDFTQFEAGPSCTEALAWLGAEVVKIENPGMGDPGRRLRKGQPDDDPYYFQMFNANKKSLAVNLKSPRGLDLVKDLLKQADICVENMAPGTIDRLGLGYQAVKAVNPSIIYCQVKGFGEGSPYERNLAFDMIAQATGGTISVTGERGRQPVKPGISLGDTGTGMTMAVTILAALRKREKTGQGAHLQVAMQDAMLHYMRTNFSTQAKTGRPVERDGTRSGGGSNGPSGLYPCAPGGLNDYVWIMTSRGNPEHWSRLCKVMGREDLIDDPRFATPALRVKNDAELDPIIRDWTMRHTKHEAMALVGGAGIPAGAVLDTMELQNDETFVRRGVMQSMEHPSYPPLRMPAWPVRIDGSMPKIEASPILGQHTAEVLSTWLSLGSAEVERLRAESVLG